MSNPLYVQIADVIRSSVAKGRYLPGQMLPSEHELMAQFSVSRVTVRRALKELVDESLLESKKGVGYIVQSTSRLNQPLNRVTSFDETCASRGLTPGSILISCKSGESNAEESAQLVVPLGSKVLRTKHVRTGNDQPLLVEHCTLLASKLADGSWFESSEYSAVKLEKLISLRIFQHYMPVLANESLARRLDIAEGAALMLLMRTGFAADDSPVEYTHCWFHPDRWTFAHETRR